MKTKKKGSLQCSAFNLRGFPTFTLSEAVTGSVQKWFIKNSQISQENTYGGVSFQ